MEVKNLNCWHCGNSLDSVPQPIGRREECPQCASSLHVCHMCQFFKPAGGGTCNEPMADDLRDREKANFCDYFRPKSGLSASADPEAQQSRARLDQLFGSDDSDAKGGTAGSASGDEAKAEAARKKLASLFGNSSD